MNEQSGIFAGTDGFDITVGGNTDLVGAAIVSDASPENNRLDTGTLTFTELENESEFEAESIKPDRFIKVDEIKRNAMGKVIRSQFNS